MVDEIKKTNSWDVLSKNPKFQEKFSYLINLYIHSMDNVTIESANNTITVTHNSLLVDRDLDCQFKSFTRTVFSLDGEHNLVINELNGKIESNYGYTFDNTDGGVFKTYYSTNIFDKDGIELEYQSYSDKYHLDNDEFKKYALDLESVTLGAFNPNLDIFTKETGVYPRANIIGKNPRFVRHIRSKNDLGIVEVTRCSYDEMANTNNLEEEYYFNTFFVSPSKLHPELIHIVNGFPFATVANDNHIVITEDCRALGLNEANYKDVARDRFQKELMEEKRNVSDDETLSRYELVLERLEEEYKDVKRIH